MKLGSMCLVLVASAMLSLPVMADTKTTPPIGFQEMQDTLSSLKSPSEASGRSFNMTKPPGFEKFELSLSPQAAFAVSNLADGKIYVSIAKGSALYDMDLFEGTGIVVLNPIKVEWKTSQEFTDAVGGGGFQSCSLNVSFTINEKVVTKTTLEWFKNHGYAVTLDYDNSVLESEGNKGSEFVFKRKNNQDASVSLTVNKPNGSVLGRAEVNNLAKCEQVAATAKWSSWSNWSACSAKCGGGIKTRTRTCSTQNQGLACSGESTEKESCNTAACEELPAQKYCVLQMKNAKWEQDDGWFSSYSTYVASYTYTYVNTHPSKKLKCKVHINGVSVYADGTVGGVQDTEEHNFVLKPGEDTTLKGKVSVTPKLQGLHTGIRENVLCTYKN